MSVDELVNSQYDQVKIMARVMKRRYPQAACDDLESDGGMGLLFAAMRYDPTRGPFRPFARSYIKGYMFNGLRSRRRIPRSTLNDLEAALERGEALEPRLAGVFGLLKPLELDKANQMPANPATADPARIVERFEEQSERENLIAQGLAVLSKTQTLIVQRRDLEEADISAVAREIGCTANTVRSQRSKALRRLRERLQGPRDA